MVQLASLWLPILLSAFGVFTASSIIWMALPIHKKDYKSLGAKENEVMAAFKAWNLGGGMFMFPHCDHSAASRKDPAVLQKMKDGPWGAMSLMAKPHNMGAMMGMWFFNLLILTTVIAYIASLTLAHGASGGQICRIVTTTALLAHGGSAMTECIWKGRPWGTLPGALFDAFAYAAVTTAVFVYLWPK